MNDKVGKLVVTYRGRVLSDDTVRARMEAADPGTGWADHSLCWSCPIMCGYARDNVAFTFGPKYDVTTVEVDR